jgi:signal transduction histidine kinase
MEDKVKEQRVDELAAMRRRITELERILEISRELTSALTLEPLLRKILTTAAELTGSEGASILLQDAHTGELRFLAAFGAVSEQVMEINIPVPAEGSIAGTILTSRQPLIVPDAQADPRLYREVEQRTGFVVRSLLGVPLQIANRCVGAVEALNKRDSRGFSQEDVKTLTALAAQAAIAIENARLYEAVVDHAERLEERVRERTAELQARNEELAAYDYTVAHDLKHPLGLVMGYAEALEEDYATMSDEELQKHLRTIAQHGRKMRSIIDELLLLAGVRDMEVEARPLDMASIVAEIRRRFASMIEEYHAEIILPDVWPVASGHGPWVEEVWVNYLSNAIKYGGQPPRLELGATKRPNDMICFWVHDNGAGLSPDKRAQLFTPFTRLDQVRAKGHGLGLSIVRRIVEKLGGQVGVESDGVPGQGSVFFFTLPSAVIPATEPLHVLASGGSAD